MSSLLKQRHVSQGMKFLLAFAILAWLAKSGKIDFAAMKMVLQPVPFIITVGLILSAYLIVTLRWRWLLSSQSIDISFTRMFRLSMIGLFFSFAIPGGFSGDVVKAYYLVRNQDDKRVTAGVSVIIDRYLGVVAMTLLSLAVMLFDFEHVFGDAILLKIFYTILALFIFCLYLGWLLFFQRGFNSPAMRRIRAACSHNQNLQQFIAAGHHFGRDKKVLAKGIAASLVGQIACTLMFLYAGSLIEPSMRWTTYFYCVPIGMMLTAIPISPGGVGVGQAAFYFLFNLYSGKPSDLGPTLATIFQMVSLGLGLLGAAFYIQHRGEVADVKP